MTAAARYGEIDADAIRHSMTAHSETWADGTHVHVVDEVHVLDESDLVRAYVARHRRATDEALRYLRTVQPVDPSTGLATFTTASPAAAFEGMTAVLPARLPLAAGAENEAPGVGIPPPRPVPPDEHFSYIQELTGRMSHPYGERFR